MKDKAGTHLLQKAFWKRFLSMIPFAIGPILLVLFMGMYLLRSTPMPYEIAMPVAVGIGAISFSGYFLTLKKSPQAKGWSLLGSLLISGLIGLSLYQYYAQHHAGYTTCPVCGYCALDEENKCKVCEVQLNEKAATTEGFKNLQEYIRAEQIAFFVVGLEGDSLTFSHPSIYPGGFAKASDWTPLISETELEAFKQ